MQLLQRRNTEAIGARASCRVDAQENDSLISALSNVGVLAKAVEIGRRWLFISPGNSGHFDPASDPSSQLVSPVRGLEIYRYVTEIPGVYRYMSSPLILSLLLADVRRDGHDFFASGERPIRHWRWCHPHPTLRSVLNIFTGHYAVRNCRNTVNEGKWEEKRRGG